MNLTIAEIAQACGGRLVLRGEGADAGTCVKNVEIDSRKVQPGGVFIAVEGERVDGHRFISDVFAKGVLLAVTRKNPEQVETEHGCKAAGWGSYLLVEDPLQALKEIAEAYRKKLSAKIVGITGSVGKTSTKEAIAAVLAEKYCVLKTEGNLNNEIGVPLTLLSIREEHQAAVVEMGISDFGEMHRLSRMARPDICVITNIGQSHLNNLIDRDGILRAKSEIFDYMAPDGEICLYGGDDKLNGLQEIGGHKPHFFGLGENPEEEVAAVEITERGLLGSNATLVIHRTEEGEKRSLRLPVHTPLPGRHMVLNAAAAACVAELLGLTGEEIAAGIGKISTISGRNNLIQLPRYILIDDCYNANPASMKAAIELLSLADTERVAILGDMLNLGEESPMLHEEVGRQAIAAGADCLICVGEESRCMFRAAQRQKEEEAGTGKDINPKILHFDDRHELLKVLAAQGEELIPKGAAVLLKASHDMGFADILAYLREAGAH